MAIAKEDHHQKAFVNWLRLEKLTYFSPINETPYKKYVPLKTFLIMEKLNQDMGKVAGVNDIFIYLPKVLLHLEFKRSKKEKQRKDQIKWENKMSQFDYCKYVVIYSYEEAIKVVEDNL